MIPDEAIAIFSRPDHNRPKDIVEAKIRTITGAPASPRTARAWHTEWKRTKDQTPLDEQTKETYSREETEGSVVAESQSSQIKTLEQLIEICQIDLTKWRVDHFQIKTYEGHRRNEQKDLTFVDGKINGTVYDEGESKVVTMYAIRAWFVKRDDEHLKDIVEDISKYLINIVVPPIKTQYVFGKHLLLPGIVDAHFGRVAHNGNYSLDQAEAEYKWVVDTIINKVQGLKLDVDQVLFPIGNDLLQADNLNNTTTRGTPQDLTSNMRDVIKVAWRCQVYAIRRFAEIAPVKVEDVEGNHDRLLTFALKQFISAWFRNEPNIVVSDKEGPRKYFPYGTNLIGMTHGDGAKAKNLAGLMADESGENWAKTKYRTFLRGHFHVENEMFQATSKYGGVSVVTFPAFCPMSEWEKVQGFFGTTRAAECRVYHHDNGPALTFSVFVDEMELHGSEHHHSPS